MIVVWILTTSICFATGQEDPCLPTTYQAIEEPWRSTGNTDTTNLRQCDSTLEQKWYRSTSGAGGTIPTTSPDMATCGTTNPVWMDDALPNSGEINDVTMCLRTPFGTCQSTWTIRVKNCDTFYVYELKQTPMCPSAYCFGDKSPCPEGQTSDTGFSPCTEILANISGINLSPNVTVGLVQTTKNLGNGVAIAKVMEFQCNIIVDSGEDISTYWVDVEWTINDNIVETFSNVAYSTYLEDTALAETSWEGTYKLGFLVKCGVRVRAAENSTPGTYHYSESFYAGIATDATEYVVSEGGSIDVTVWLTVPLGCMHLASQTPDQIDESLCTMDLKVRTPDYYENGQLKCTPGGVTDEPISFANTNLCGVTFSFLEMNAVKTFTIYGSGDNLVNLNSRSIFIRMTTDFALYHSAWTGATSPDIHVVVSDEDINMEGKFCAARTDPNMWTFDGSYWFYQHSGEHVLYQHNILPIRVHAVFDSCLWGGACVCGVAVRNGDALFVVNVCRSIVGTPWTSGTTNTNQYIEQRACDDTHMTIESDGSDMYTITLSSGTVVTISLRMDVNKEYTYVRYVQVKPSLMDWRSSTGLCGVLDGDSTNDMQTRAGLLADSWSEFGNDWRLNTAVDGSSLFDVIVSLSEFSIPPLQYCRCRANATNWVSLSDHVICNLNSTVTSCAEVTDTSSYFTECDKSPNKRKRTTYSDSPVEPTKFGVVLNENYVEPGVYEWRNGWNSTLARESCRLAFSEDTLLTKCKEVVPRMTENVAASEEECMNDILVSANTEFMKDTVAALKTTCITEAKRSENLTTKGSNGDTGMTFLEELIELSCPNNCSGNGNCINGSCVCISDLYGNDCSLRKTTPPIIRQTGTDGLCKTDQSACRSFVIPGFNFIDSQLTCRVRYLKIYSDRWDILNGTDDFPALYMNSLYCICSIPVTRRKRSDQNALEIAEGYFLSVSNDGVNFSNETTFIVHDSTCYECHAESVLCTKLSTCPTTTTQKYESKQNKGQTKDVIAVICGSVAAVIIFILLAFITVFCFKKHTKRSQVGDSTGDVRKGTARMRFYNSYDNGQRPATARSVRESDIILNSNTWPDDDMLMNNITDK